MCRRLVYGTILLLASFLLSGCAASIHPLYEDKDDLLDPTPYAGVWQSERWMVRVDVRRGDKRTKSTFGVSLLEVPVGPHADGREPIPADSIGAFVGGIVKIGDQAFLDLATPPGALRYLGAELAPSALLLLMPAHTFFKIQHKKDRVVLIPLHPDKLDKLLAREPKAVTHTKINSLEFAELNCEFPLPSMVLTGKTAELREFLRKHADADIWLKDTLLEFRRGNEKDFEKRLAQVTSRLVASHEARDKAAKPPLARAKKWSLPAADAEKWAARIRKVVPDQGWTVTIRGNDIIAQRKKAVRFAEVLASAPGPGPQLSDGDYRITLRFAPKMSYDEYETRDAENTAMDQEQKKLRQSVDDIPHKDDDYIGRTPEEEQRVKKYREAAAKLVRHTLPDLYTPDYSIHVFQSWNGLARVVDKEVARECAGVCQGLLRYFGMYISQFALQSPICWRREAPPRVVTPPPRVNEAPQR